MDFNGMTVAFSKLDRQKSFLFTEFKQKIIYCRWSNQLVEAKEYDGVSGSGLMGLDN
jgi:hypothetical protein